MTESIFLSVKMSTKEATVTNRVYGGIFQIYRCIDNPDADKVLKKQWWNGFIAGAVAVELVVILGIVYMRRCKN